jgi:hypothetical protein
MDGTRPSVGQARRSGPARAASDDTVRLASGTLGPCESGRRVGQRRPTIDVATVTGIRTIDGSPRRSIGTAPVRKAPATADVVTMRLPLCPDSLAGERDRAFVRSSPGPAAGRRFQGRPAAKGHLESAFQGSHRSLRGRLSWLDPVELGAEIPADLVNLAGEFPDLQPDRPLRGQQQHADGNRQSCGEPVVHRCHGLAAGMMICG